MAYRERLESWLASFGAQHNIGLELSDDGWCVFSADTVRCDLVYFENPPMYRLIAALMEAPDDNEEGVLRWLLEENFLGSLMRGINFAIDPEHNEVVLLFDHIINENDDEQGFITVLNNFIDIAEKIPRQLVSWLDEREDGDDLKKDDQDPSPGTPGNWISV